MVYLLNVTAFLNILLGFFTFTNKIKSKAHIFFFIFTIGIASWAFTNAQFQEASNESEMYFWAVVAYQAASFMLFFIRLFAYEISGSSGRITWKTAVSLGCLSFGFIAPLFKGAVSTGVNFEEKSILPGHLLPLLFATYLFFLVDVIYILFSSLRKSSGIKLAQLRYISWGLLGSIISGVTTNIILPAFQVYSAVALGPSFTLFNLALVTYAIIRHRLFDIRVVIGRIIYYLILAVFTFAVFFSLVFIYESLFDTVFAVPVYFISLPVSLGFILSFNWLNKYIRTQVSYRFINPGYDPIDIIDKLSNTLTLNIDLQEVTQEVIGVSQRTIRPKFSTIVVFSDDEIIKSDQFFSNNDNSRNFNFPSDKVLALWSITGLHPIVYDEIELELFEGKYANIPILTNIIKKSLQEIDAKIVMPLSTKDSIKGVFVFGRKEADEPFTVQDITFLQQIVNSANVAIERSLLYLEVQNFANTLKLEVDSATKELKKANAELADSLRKEKDMMDILGHELRTPLSIARNAILMMDMLFRGKKNVQFKNIEQLLEKAKENIRREIKILETVLSTTRIENERLTINFSKVDAKDVVNDSVDGFVHWAKRKNLRLIVDVPDKQLFCIAGREQIQEVLDNLVSNAIKYTTKGSIKIKLEDGQDFLKFSVCDTGIGIPESEIPNLGKKFHRINAYVDDKEKNENDTKRLMRIVRPGGTGIGLYVVFGMVKMMKGEVKIQSEIGKGSTFSFTIPKYT